MYQEMAWDLAEAPKTSALLISKYSGPVGKEVSSWVAEHWFKTVTGGLSFALVKSQLETIEPIAKSSRMGIPFVPSNSVVKTGSIMFPLLLPQLTKTPFITPEIKPEQPSFEEPYYEIQKMNLLPEIPQKRETQFTSMVIPKLGTKLTPILTTLLEPKTTQRMIPRLTMKSGSISESASKSLSISGIENVSMQSVDQESIQASMQEAAQAQKQMQKQIQKQIQQLTQISGLKTVMVPGLVAIPDFTDDWLPQKRRKKRRGKFMLGLGIEEFYYPEPPSYSQIFGVPNKRRKK
jgi:hypothetical protein